MSSKGKYINLTSIVLSLKALSFLLYNKTKIRIKYQNNRWIFIGAYASGPTGNYNRIGITTDLINIDDSMKKAGHDSSNGLSGKKGSINEGGHRVPFVAVWPGIIKPNTESKVGIVGQDVVATVAALSNQKLDTSKVFDSANLIPVFKNNTTQPVHQYLIHQSKAGPTYAIRDGQWKLIIKGVPSADMTKNKPIALYDLNENVNEIESKNLVKNPEYSEKVKKL